MATEQEIQTAINRLLAAKLRGHAKALTDMADNIEAGSYRPSDGDLRAMDQLPVILGEQTITARERGRRSGLMVIEGA